MIHTQGLTKLTVLFLLGALPLALAHGHESHDGEMEGMGAPKTAHLASSHSMSVAAMNSSSAAPQSYFTYPNYGGLMLAHIVLMTIAWFFFLPISECIQVTSLGRKRTNTPQV